MSILPLNHHYSMENPASVYNEEAMTALELAGRTTAKVNECVSIVNGLGERADQLITEIHQNVDTVTRDEISKMHASGEFADIVEDQIMPAYDRRLDDAESQLADIEPRVKATMTPEAFGAVGDGETDDTEAFRQALNSGYRISCTPGAVYNLNSNIIKVTNTNVQLDGNNATIRNACFKLNTGSSDSTWSSEYPAPVSFIRNVHFENVDRDYLFKTGLSMDFENITFSNYDLILETTANYIDYFSFRNIRVRYHNGDNYAFVFNNLGDQLNFERVHIYQSENMKLLSATERNSAHIVQCLNGEYYFPSGTVHMDACHLENGSKISGNAVMTISNCFIWGCVQLPSYPAHQNVIFESCKFLVNFQTMEHGYKLNTLGALKTKNCFVYADTNSIAGYSIVSLDKLYNDKADNSTLGSYSTNAVLPGANCTQMDTGAETWTADLGAIRYTVYPSLDRLTINNLNAEYAISTVEGISVDNNQTANVFYIDTTYQNAYLHVYRENTDTGECRKCVIRMTTPYFIDYGSNLSGVAWVQGYAPDVNTNKCQIKDDVIIFHGNTYSYDKFHKNTGTFFYDTDNNILYFG